ncbi:MAG: serine hydrolase [Alphaproteobacteria bacterium]|nr:serine hydrolase [Alphaproteobacteria bacterium]
MLSPDFALKIMRKAAHGLVLSAFLVSTLLAGVPPVQARPNPKYAGLVMDADTGQILYESNADKRLHPASLTKIMTLLMVFEALDQGRLGLRDRVRISPRAASMAPSKIGLKPGSTIRVQDAIYAVVTKSANDISAALAEHIAGSESNFARQMTQRARALGMSNTVFTNASGLHNPRQVTTARDMARLARFVITQYPDYYRYYSKVNFSYGGRNYSNHNHLMKTYRGMDGMKTGYIAPSGFNLVASAVRDKHRLIGVVFGGRSAASRNKEMASLLDAGFAKIRSMPSRPATPPVLVADAVPAQPAPLPVRKPPVLTAAAVLGKMAPGAGIQLQQKRQEFTASLTAASEVAPADLNPAATESPRVHMASFDPTRDFPRENFASDREDKWAIQVGAFSSRATTDQVLQKSLKKLPMKFASASPVIAPMKTSDGWLFRARLHGFSQKEALNACRYLNDCVPVAPQN